jgi:hypothetical protein
MYPCTHEFTITCIHVFLHPASSSHVSIHPSVSLCSKALAYMWPRRDDCGFWDVLRRYGDLVITFHQIDFGKNCVTMQAVWKVLRVWQGVQVPYFSGVVTMLSWR